MTAIHNYYNYVLYTRVSIHVCIFKSQWCHGCFESIHCTRTGALEHVHCIGYSIHGLHHSTQIPHKTFSQ